MFSKLLTIVLAAGLIAASLLVVRQRRLDLAHETSRLHRRLQALEPRLWDLEAEIARRCRPEAVRVSVLQLDIQWVPIPDRIVMPVQVDFALVENRDAGGPGQTGG